MGPLPRRDRSLIDRSRLFVATIGRGCRSSGGLRSSQASRSARMSPPAAIATTARRLAQSSAEWLDRRSAAAPQIVIRAITIARDVIHNPTTALTVQTGGIMIGETPHTPTDMSLHPRFIRRPTMATARNPTIGMDQLLQNIAATSNIGIVLETFTGTTTAPITKTKITRAGTALTQFRRLGSRMGRK